LLNVLVATEMWYLRGDAVVESRSLKTIVGPSATTLGVNKMPPATLIGGYSGEVSRESGSK